MRTVKEISDITGISMRTLRYYDEIGLLKPPGKARRDTGSMTIRPWNSFSRFCSSGSSTFP